MSAPSRFATGASTLRRTALGLLAACTCVCTSASVILRAQPAAPAVPLLDVITTIIPNEPRIVVDAQLTMRTAAETSELQLRLDPRFATPEVEVVAPAALAGPVAVARAGNRVTARLASPAAPGTTLVLRCRYAVSNGWTRSFYAGADGAYISGESFYWYPLPTGSRRATGTLRFRVPDGFVVAATGARTTTGTQNEPFVFTVTDPTTFSFAAGRHAVHRSEGRPAIALHLLRARPRIQQRLQQLRAIVSALEAEFGPYPHPDLEIVEMPAFAAGNEFAGVSLEGFLVVGEGQLDSMNLAFFAHEIGHQWWTDSVFGVGVGRSLLTEGMAQFAALRVVERLHGARAASEFRWRGYPGYGFFDNGRGYVSLMLAGLDAAPTANSVPSHLPYSKAFLLHDLMARTVGRDAFRDAAKAFAQRHRFSDVTWTQFIAEIGAATGTDLASFTAQWYDRAGVPQLSVTWSQKNRQLHAVITQSEPYYAADFSIVVEGSGRQQRERIRIEGARTSFDRQVPFSVTAVTIDPDFEVPSLTPERRQEAELVLPLARAFALAQDGSDFVVAVNSVYAAHPDRDQPRHRFMRAATLYHEAYRIGDFATARPLLEEALAASFKEDTLLPGMYYDRAVMARAADDTRLLTDSIAKAVAADRALVAPSGWGAAAEELLQRR